MNLSLLHVQHIRQQGWFFHVGDPNLINVYVVWLFDVMNLFYYHLDTMNLYVLPWYTPSYKNLDIVIVLDIIDLELKVFTSHSKD